MENNWEKRIFGELGEIVTGKTPSTRKKSNFGGLIPFVTPRDLDGSKTIIKTERYLSEQGAQSVKNAILPPNAVMVSCIGTVGKVAIAGKRCVTNQQINSIVVSDYYDLNYIYYNLSARKDEIRGLAGGTAQPILNKGHFSQLDITLPPLTEQKAIAHILGSLDDKIELNRRMNETLEAMAQALFKSWFVDFDPVIDNALAAGNDIPEELKERAEVREALGEDRKPLPEEIQKLFPSEFEHSAEMGWIPKGWRVSTVGEEVEIVGGGTPSTKNESYWTQGRHAFCTPKDMSTLPTKVLLQTERLLTDKGVAKVSSRQLPVGTVLMSSRAPIGYLAIADIPVTVNQGIIAMVKQERFSELFLLCWASCNMDKIMARANGSTFLEISKRNFRPIPFLLSEDDIRKAFNRQANTITKRLLACARNMKELSDIRDTLLPQLLSGEIRIPEAEKLLEEAEKMMRDDL